MVVIVTDEPVPNPSLLAATAGVTTTRNIRPTAYRKAINQPRRMGRNLAPYAVQPRWFDASDSALRVVDSGGERRTRPDGSSPRQL